MQYYVYLHIFLERGSIPFIRVSRFIAQNNFKNYSVSLLMSRGEVLHLEVFLCASYEILVGNKTVGPSKF